MNLVKPMKVRHAKIIHSKGGYSTNYEMNESFSK